MESCNSSYMLFFVMLCYLIAISHSIKHRCHDDERSALLQFKHSFLSTNTCSASSDYPKLESWKFVEGESSGDCCTWDGVECDNRTNHVISLDLSNSCLSGSINSNTTISDLFHLRRLNLAYNSFRSSPIPSRIGNLSSLTHLNLSFSGFSGLVPPQLFNLSNLVSLDLSSDISQLKLENNSLRKLAQNLIFLKNLDLSAVNISSSVPDLISGLSSLESLYLDGCLLSGEFPVSILQLPNLKLLDLSFNPDLTVPLPDFHSRIPVKSLRLRGTNLAGEIPASISNLVSLEELELSNCRLNDQLPSSVKELVHWKSFKLNNCNFSREFAYSIGNLIHLKQITITDSIFIDQIPVSFSNLTDLVYLDLSSNHFSPATTSSFFWIGKLTKLTSLYLHNMSLNGEIPPGISNLTQLSALFMGYNQLTGPIPPNLMNLTRLRTLRFNSNRLSGQIPSQISRLTLLLSLDLSSNKIEGSIPYGLYSLNNLSYLDLSFNKLAGTIDFSMFFKLKNIWSLNLSFNNLSLIIQNINSNSSIPNLRVLGLATCNLSEFPKFLRNQNQLGFLDLSSNNIDGQIPSWICDIGLNSMDLLNLSHNHLSGFEQDPLVLQWPKLRTLDLRSNVLEGTLPIPPSSINSYLISKNKLSGEISPLICNLIFIQSLDLSFNNLSGALPNCLGSLSNSISLLDLKQNNFHGNIPSTWRSGCRLRMISMSHNELVGPLPSSLANCSLLEFVDFGNNQIVDSFPKWLGTLSDLRILILRSNGFFGVIDEVGAVGFLNLRVVDLSGNNFSGLLPLRYLSRSNSMKVRNSNLMSYMEKYLRPENGYYISSYYGSFEYSMTLYNKGLEMNYLKIPNIFIAVDFSNNKFQGEIPEMIGNLKGLQLLNLSRNILQGPIPSSLENLKALECLDLSENQLSGQIPTMLTDITALSSFDVSFNHLSGPIPQGNQFCTFETKSYEGNPGLWVETWTKQCGNARSTPVEPPPVFMEDEDSESAVKINWLVVLMGFGSGLIVGVVAGNMFLTRKQYWFSKKFGRKQRKHRIRRIRNRN
ncbi:receptor-like protein 33 [Mercurialis annua]|uniref:receptor-like protein 33 n=1 Tax=Mercurialis annua TaxID=3986 RepID=UPI00215F6C99|nr:receptor-like protein 33 [Mercurialis annua]